jgi:intracellular sulfur oxidation DsrE/DsrF family protein
MANPLYALPLLALVAFGPSQAPKTASLKVHRVVIEVNVPGEMAYQIVLGNITNLRKAMAPEPVEVEVVCEGKGVDMVLKSGPVLKGVATAQKNGIKFMACNNTLKFRKLDPKRLISGVSIVPAGVAQVVRRQEEGWSYLKGAF